MQPGKCLNWQEFIEKIRKGVERVPFGQKKDTEQL